MAVRRHYDEELRAIGQALESKGVTGFELYNLKAGYIIRHLSQHKPSLKSALRNWLRKQNPRDRELVTYGLAFNELEEISKAGRARRSHGGQFPEFDDQSNILRTIGAYVDSKQADLAELHKRPTSITLAYRDKSGHEYRENRPVSSFQDIFLELCEKRSRTEQIKIKSF